MPTTADLVAGPSGVGLGAVLANGVDDVITIDCGDVAVQSITVEFWLYPTGGEGVMRGPDQGWTIQWDETDEFIRWTVNLGSGTVQVDSPNGSVPADRWTHILLARNGGTGVIQIYIDGALVTTTSPGSSIDYGSSEAMLFLSDGATFFEGRLGFVRFSGVARGARYAMRAYLLMRRSPVEFDREIVEAELGQTADATTYDQSAADLDAVGDGALTCDGFITDEATAQEVLGRLAVFREFRHGRSSAGEITLDIARPATVAVASFGDGDEGGFNNIVDIKRYTESDLEEAVKTQPLAYRLQRDENGAFKNYQHTVNADVLSVGKEADAIELPFVYAHRCADYLRHWLGKLLAARDKFLEITTAHEARKRSVGEVVSISIPHMGLTKVEFEVLSRAHRIRLVDLGLSPYDPAAFTHVDGDQVERDVVVEESSNLVVGADSRIAVHGGGTRGTAFIDLRLDIEIGTVQTLSIVGNGDGPRAGNVAFGSPVGAGTAWEAVQTDDGNTSYIPATSTTNASDALFTFSAPTTSPAGSGVRMVVVGRKSASAFPAISDHFGIIFKTNGTVVQIDNFDTLPNTEWVRTERLQVRNPVTGLAWTQDELTNLQVGAFATVAPTSLTGARITFVGVSYMPRNERPTGFSYAKVWRKGPSATQPEDPEDDEAPIRVLPQLIGIHDNPQQSGIFWYWARVFDAFDRSAALIGPVSVDMDGTPLP